MDNKQIDEMSDIIENSILTDDMGYITHFDTDETSEALYNAGYRKESEVAKQILEEFECNISTGIRILKDCINDADTDQVKRHLLGRLKELCGMEKFIAYLKKKYIGE